MQTGSNGWIQVRHTIGSRAKEMTGCIAQVHKLICASSLFFTLPDSDSTRCSACPNTRENWLCLKCHVVFCGRFAEGHMVRHFEETGHALAAGLDDISFWCYQCESYIYHRTVPKLYDAYHKLTVLKFHEPPVDGPLPSADPQAIVSSSASSSSSSSSAGVSAAGSSSSSSSKVVLPLADDAAIDEDCPTDEDEDSDIHMETSRSRAARAPERSSSQLEPYEGNEQSQTSETPSRYGSNVSNASNATENTCAYEQDTLSPSSSSSSLETPSEPICPIEGLSPSQLAHPLVQRLTGVIYGNALGDAFGLSTEFLSSEQVRAMYGDEYDPVTGRGSIPFPHYKKTRHSARWETGDWTDDSDQMILILETCLESYAGENRTNPSPSVLDAALFASKLRHWVRHGFPELGDPAGLGLGALTCAVVSHPKFLHDPHFAAEAVWTSGGKKAAANGGLMRTSICGVFDYYARANVIANTLNMCTTTHADPRCKASCVLATTIISEILNGAPIDTSEECEQLIQSCINVTLQYVKDLEGENKSAFMDYVRMTRLSEMELDGSSSIGYTLKCLAAGLYGLRSRESFVPTLTRLVREAGDADTNGAICGAMIGAKIGYNGLPQAWLKAMPNKRWLDKKVVELIKLMMDRYKAYKESQSPSSSSSSS